MYRILTDGTTFCDSRVEDLAVINPVVNLEMNRAGTFEFTVPPNHPFYNSILKRKTLIEVYRDDEIEPVFAGFAVSIDEDFYKQQNVICEGELTFFNETVQRPHYYHGVTVRGLFEALIANHNALCNADETFKVGQVTVTDPNNSISCYSNYETTMKCLQDDLINDLGGFLRIRHESDGRYLDYLAETQNTNSQVIELGKNLINYNSTLDTSEMATVIIPLGATLEEQEIEGLDARLTVKSVNGGKDYVESTTAIAEFGRIEKVVTWDNVTVASNLLNKARKYLNDTQFENLVIEAQAVDLHMASAGIESFKLLDKIRVISKPHGLDRYFVLSRMKLNLNDPARDTITLGISENKTLSASSQAINANILNRLEEIQPASILESAKANATEMLTTAQNGYVTTITDTDGHAKEILIMDAPTLEASTKIWRWNQNGLGYSNDGGKTYGLAITQNGAIVADFITSGDLNAARIKGGILTLGGNNNVNGVMRMLDASGNEVGTWNKDGINAKGTFTTFTESGHYSETKGSAFTLYDTAGVEVGRINVGKVSASDGRKIFTIAASHERFTGEGTALYLGTHNAAVGGVAPHYILNLGINPDGHTDRHIFRNGTARIINNGGLYIGSSDARISRVVYTDVEGIGIYNSCYVYGSLGCAGTKYRVVETDNYGKVGMNAMESTEAYFSDLGTVECDEDGIAEVVFESKYLETVDTDKPYLVQITQLSEHTGWVEKQDDKFIIHSAKGARFDWICYHKQKGFSDVRMENVEIKEPQPQEVEPNE